MEMQDLIQGFIDEAHELLGKMEESLLILENESQNDEAVSSIFRVMHTLKGSGAMFGFTWISSFTHHLENIYDGIKSHKIELDKEILNLTFESVDLLKNLLISPEEPKGEVKKEYDRLFGTFEKICSGPTKNTNSIAEKTQKPEVAHQKKQPTYHIYFEPNEEIMKNGTNPLYLIDELVSLGNGIVFAHTEKIPDFLSLNPQSCSCSWDIILTASVDFNEILDVFIFVEDDSKIEIQKISEINLLSQTDFTNKLPNYIGEGNNSAILELQEFAQQVENSLQGKTEPNHLQINAEKPIIKNQLDKEESPISNETTEVDAAVRLSNINEVPQRSKVNSSIRVSSEKVEMLINLVSEMVTTQARLNLLAQKVKNPEMIEVAETLEKLTRQLRDNAFEISLIPISSLVTRFQRLIRDLSKELNKEVEFITEGTDTELDKTIIESLSDPLMHIFRNAIDHGLENAEERKIAGKPVKGELKFKAYYSGTSVYIDISDDGKGIDTNKVRQKALKQGLINEHQKLNDQQINELILLPGFSTAENVTDISGRGVGMDVVKKNINKIQGEIEIFSTPGKGTTFSLKLPLTLSIIDGIVVQIDEREYIIPILVINKIKPVKHQLIVDSFNNMLSIDGEQIPFLYLREKFNISSPPPVQEELVVVSYANKSVGIVIDRVIRESQVVVKSIGKHFREQEMVSGASIMGDGSVALVLDTNKIIDKYSR